MRLTSCALMLVSTLIGGCASSRVDCSMGAGKNGCFPGTEQYDEMLMQQQDAKSASEIDAARCSSYGAPGSPANAECRRRATADQQLLEPHRGSQNKNAN